MSRRDEEGRDFLRVIAAYLLPPVAILLKNGMTGQFFINCLLTLFFWVPGQLHALWVVATTKEDGQVAQDGTWTFLSYLALWVWPVAVIMKRGIGMTLLINLGLSLLLGFPGMIHAAWVVTKRD